MTGFAETVQSQRNLAVRKTAFAGSLGILLTSSGALVFGGYQLLGLSGQILTGLYAVVALISAGAALYTGVSLALHAQSHGIGSLSGSWKPDPMEYTAAAVKQLARDLPAPILISGEKLPFIVDFSYPIGSTVTGTAVHLPADQAPVAKRPARAAPDPIR
jgi:hypothetical protein